MEEQTHPAQEAPAAEDRREDLAGQDETTQRVAAASGERTSAPFTVPVTTPTSRAFASSIATLAADTTYDAPTDAPGDLAIATPDDSFTSLPTDLALLTAPATKGKRRRPRPSVGRAFNRRLVLLAPAAALLLIVGVTLTGLSLERWNLASFAGGAPFGARPSPTATLIPTDTTAPIYNTPTPRPTVDAHRLFNARRNAAMGCVNGAPPALAKPIYTSKGFGANEPPPNEVALTFDDGPTPYTTPPILDFLEQTHTPATFFVEGGYTRIWPYLVQREWNDGFAIGAHSWDHPILTILPDGQMGHQFGDTMDSIHAALGANACVWFWRPPYGSYNPRIISFAQSYGLTTVMWDNDSVDYSRPGPERIAATVLSEAHPGAVILMHDGPARREQTLAALPLILDGLKARGLTPVTLPRLLADSHYPGVEMQDQPQRPRHDPTDEPPLALPLDPR